MANPKLWFLIVPVAVMSLYGSPARSADPPIALPEERFVPEDSWTGFYVGLHASLMFGAQVGINYQIGSLVFGIEADASIINAGQEVDYRWGPFDLADGRGEASWLATVRGRLGYAAGRFLIYGTGGVAFTEVDARADIIFFGEDTDTRSFTGWTAGGGIEAMITPNVTARIEYLYADFDKGEFSFHDGWITEEVEFDAHIVRAGLNFKFGW